MGATRGNGKPGLSAQTVAQALQNTARDTPEAVQEEGAGAWDLRKALAKLEPAPEPKPEPFEPEKPASPVAAWVEGEIARFERYLKTNNNQAARNVLDYLQRRRGQV